MKEIPMIFNTEMVNAILEGRKTQTRRLVKYRAIIRRSAPCQPGDRIYVRETFSVPPAYWGYMSPRDFPEGINYIYKQESPDSRHQDLGTAWIPSIHMPKQAARIWLEVVRVRAERLQEISESDAIKEGCETANAFQRLWENIYGSDNWYSNPWVWVIEFKFDESFRKIRSKFRYQGNPCYNCGHSTMAKKSAWFNLKTIPTVWFAAPAPNM